MYYKIDAAVLQLSFLNIDVQHDLASPQYSVYFCHRLYSITGKMDLMRNIIAVKFWEICA